MALKLPCPTGLAQGAQEARSLARSGLPGLRQVTGAHVGLVRACVQCQVLVSRCAYRLPACLVMFNAGLPGSAIHATRRTQARLAAC